MGDPYGEVLNPGAASSVGDGVDTNGAPVAGAPAGSAAAGAAGPATSQTTSPVEKPRAIVFSNKRVEANKVSLNLASAG